MEKSNVRKFLEFVLGIIIAILGSYLIFSSFSYVLGFGAVVLFVLVLIFVVVFFVRMFLKRENLPYKWLVAGLFVGLLIMSIKVYFALTAFSP
ncbi:MAG: hypothetical protein V1672_03075 [Candidatus Diapherotrites archaeon]